MGTVELTHIRRSDWREMPWRNGGGVLWELWAEPSGAGALEEFAYRLSFAAIARSAPFSRYEGCDRTIAHVSGGSFSLDVGAQSLTVSEQSPIASFPGDVATTCRLHGEPARVFNVVTNRARAAHRLRLIPLGARPASIAVHGRRVFVAALGGPAECTLGGTSVHLDTEDSAHATNELIDESLIASGPPGTTLAVVDLDLRGVLPH